MHADKNAPFYKNMTGKRLFGPFILIAIGKKREIFLSEKLIHDSRAANNQSQGLSWERQEDEVGIRNHLIPLRPYVQRLCCRYSGKWRRPFLLSGVGIQ